MAGLDRVLELRYKCIVPIVLPVACIDPRAGCAVLAREPRQPCRYLLVYLPPMASWQTVSIRVVS